MVGVIYKDSPKGLYTTSTDSDKTGSAPYSQRGASLSQYVPATPHQCGADGLILCKKNLDSPPVKRRTVRRGGLNSQALFDYNKNFRLYLIVSNRFHRV